MSNRHIVVMLVFIGALVAYFKHAQNQLRSENVGILMGSGNQMVPFVDLGERWIVSTSSYMQELAIYLITTTNKEGTAFSGFSKVPIAPGTKVKFEVYQHYPNVDVGKCKLFIVSPEAK